MSTIATLPLVTASLILGLQGGAGRLLNLHEGIQVRGHRGWQASQESDIELLAGEGALFPDHTMEGRAGGHEDGVVPEEHFGLGDEGGGRLQS
jgi:hypothetical protein